MEMTRTKLAEGVYLTYLPARKFKTSLLSAQFAVPIRQETASAYALLPAVLRRGTVTYPDMGSLSARLDRLYGARIDYTVRKKGENQCVGFVASFIDDSFAPGGEKLLEPVADLLGELICDPATERGRFVPAYFESEKTNLIDAIRSLINDKRDYADSRLLWEMCAGEPYGISRLGSEETAEKLQLRKLYAQYGQLIATSRLELFYSGSADENRVVRALRSAFSTLPRENIQNVAIPQDQGGGPHGGGGAGRDPGQAGHGLLLRQQRHGGAVDGQHTLRRKQQLQAVFERPGEVVPLLLRLVPVPPAEGTHHRFLRH